MTTETSSLETDAHQLNTVFRTLEKITGMLTDIKSDMVGKLDYLTERNLHLQVAVEKISKRLDTIVEAPAKDAQNLVVTPQNKMHDPQLKKQVQTLRAEIFKLSEENAELRKMNKSTRRIFEPRPIIRNAYLDSYRSGDIDASNDDFIVDGGAEIKKKVREFCLDSNPSYSLKGRAEPKFDLVSEKDDNSDNESVKTSKNGNNQGGSKGNAQRLANEFRITGERIPHFDVNTPDMSRNNSKTEVKPIVKQTSVFSVDKPSARPATSTNIMTFPQPPLLELNRSHFDSESHSDDSKVSSTKGKSIRPVKDFSDFQKLLIDLKASLNASIYASFNNDIEENVQLLTGYLERYKALDDKIENAYQEVKAQRSQLRISCDSLSNSQSGNLSNFVTGNNSPDKTYLRGIRSKLRDLRLKSNLHTYEQKLINIQSNPSELESFMYTIKGELGKREHIFTEIQKMGGIH